MPKGRQKILDDPDMIIYYPYLLSRDSGFMIATQKSQYAMRAIFELAKCQGRGPVKIGDIADSQAIPQRFLENILNQLRQGGVVESRRVKDGSYLLARPARQISAGMIIRQIDGAIFSVEFAMAPTKNRCPLYQI